MQRKSLLWFLLCLVCLGGALYFWRLGDQWQAQKAAAPASNQPATNAFVPQPQANTPHSLAAATNTKPSPTNSPSAASATNRYPYRLANTAQPVGQLVHNDKAILLANALLDTGKPLNLATIPDRLRAPANSGSYVVQSRAALDEPFRALLRDAGATIVSYIPNNAYLVRVSDAGARQLSANGQTQSVLPYEPYYKLEPSLLNLAMEHPAELPPNGLNVTVFPDAYQSTLVALRQLGAVVTGGDRSPFGPVLQVQPAPGTLSAVASLPGVQGVSPMHPRRLANDLDRPRLNVAPDSVTSTNYLGLSGSNVVVNINDGGVDINHPDFAGRLTSDSGAALFDSDGHGTHVAGTILGSGSKSSTVTNAQGSATNANFRGMAPNAQGFVMQINAHPDSYLQEHAAQARALISNNSWNYGDDPSYDIAAASFDAAVRDALPAVPGSQPLLFVFAAGNNGGGFDDGTATFGDNILSPATGKNVITVGAIEQPRFITNIVNVDGGASDEMRKATDSSDQVASFSSRGNVGINVEGAFGRFKPDVVAPGTFVISDRSTTWDTNAYYHPTNHNFFLIRDQTVDTNSLTPFLFPVPQGAVQIVITLLTNELSLTNLPPLPIYVQVNDFPTLADLVGTNQVVLPTNSPINLPVNAGDTIFYDVGNTTNVLVNFDVLIEVLSTNDVGDFFQVYQALNDGLSAGPPWYYRYESGTSMAAAGVSGTLACMQEFFSTTLKLTPSPALLKALLINGSRPVSDRYNLLTANSSQPTSQGWGLPSLPNSIPPALTNFPGSGFGVMPLQFFDQDPANALATGQSKTRNLVMTTDGANQDLRITLVWTDPPGNPVAGVKLVNDLDLIVSNLDTGQVFYGNNFQGRIPFSQAWDTNGAPNLDSINNVENVYLPAPLNTNYSITVLGRRVNVNAVTANTNDIVQDYALVVSSGDAGVATATFTLADANAGTIVSNNFNVVIALSNSAPLLNQRVGANSQFSGSTNGTAAQWNFYVFTNTLAISNANFTNVVFATFLPPNLGVVRMGASGELGPPDLNATRFAGADLDLYVSTNSALTNLDTNVLAVARRSVTRTGDEAVFFTDSTPGQVYYVGVKSEDQEAAQYNLIGFATDIPLSSRDTNGNVVINMNTVPLVLPGGTPTIPTSVFLIGVCTQPMTIRKAVVTNTIACQDFGDYIGALSAGTNSVVLNNHSFFDNVNDSQETLVYDDSGENEFPGSRASRGPGTLRGFTGTDALATPLWTFTMVNDSSLTDTGAVLNMSILLEPQPPPNTGFFRVLPGNSWFYGFVDIPADATNLTISISGNTQPVDLYIRAGRLPTTGAFDDFAVLPSPGGSLSISKFSSPPLNAGRYFFGIFNPNPTPQNLFILVQVDLSLTPVTPVNFLSRGNEPLLDDAVTYSTNSVGIDGLVVSAEVGVRIDHPRESDLVMTLISPHGTRVLLAENRGGLDTNGYGSGFDITNNAPPQSAGGFATDTNPINTVKNSGTLIVNYNFETIPDDMRVYYDGVRIFDTGLISGVGKFAVNFGPGNATSIVIVMDEPGTEPTNNSGTAWTYTATVVTRNTSFAVFTEDTKLTTTPIKFAVPPFGRGASFIPAKIVDSNSFEGVLATNYNQGDTIDGWTVTGLVGIRPPAVVTVPALADTGTNVLALHSAIISRTLPTIPGQNYTLSFVNHGRPALTPVSWWKGDHTLLDSADGNNMQSVGMFDIAYQFAIVNTGIQLVGDIINQKLDTGDPANLALTNALTIEGWIQVERFAFETPGTVTILERGDNTGINNAYHLGISPANQLEWYITGANHVNTPIAVGAVSVGVIGVTGPADFTHVSGTFNRANSNLNLYVNGTLVDQRVQPNTPIGALDPANQPGVGLGNSGTTGTNNPTPFFGTLDEITIYDRELSPREIQDVYAAGNAGKQPVGSTEPVTATVLLDGTTITNLSGIDQWTTNLITFTATGSNMVLSIVPTVNLDGTFQDGTLLDSFKLVQGTDSNPTNFYLPEESLKKLAGENARGDWRLEVLDNRVGATNPAPMLVSWQLSLVLADQVPFAIPLIGGVPQTNLVAPSSIAYYLVDVPAWASFATNFLTTSRAANLLFNQNILPGANATDFTLLNNLTGPGVSTLSNGSVPRLVPGKRYYLAVQNTSPTATVNFTIEVDFDITTLTNAVPYTSAIAAGNIQRYFQFDVDSNALVTLFQILNPSGNVELVARKGAPLPTTSDFDYLSASPGASPQSITVLTNSSPVPLAPGRWYLGVFNNDSNTVTYAIMATEAGPPNIIPLTNGVPFNFNSAPGPAITNFFLFAVTNDVPAALFELYNLSGNVDLTLDRETFPYAQPFLQYSFNPGTNAEQIVIRTNVLGTNIIANWYLGVPNNTAGNVTYAIRATISTNGLLISTTPLKVKVTPPKPGATTGPTLAWPSVKGEHYEIQSSTDLITWTTIATVTATGQTMTFTDPAAIVPGVTRYYRIIQVP